MKQIRKKIRARQCQGQIAENLEKRKKNYGKQQRKIGKAGKEKHKYYK
jgi:hypothetical protein